MILHPLLILLIGILIVIGMIIVFRINAFIALITAAIVVSLLSPVETGPDAADPISRVATAFGNTAGSIGIVIALASVIGKCMMDSGAADRIVRAFLNLLGEKKASFALMGSGFVLSVPVFFDTVFYLLVPLARSLYRKTNKNYLLSVLAISAGGAITHTLVPPTPGPLAMAGNLNIDLGVMIGVGALVAAPAALAGLVFAKYLDHRMPIPMRPLGHAVEPDPIADEDLPPLWLSLLPVLLPVILISMNTIAGTFAKLEPESVSSWKQVQQFTEIIGNANLAMLLSTVVAMITLSVKCKPSLAEISESVESSLMSGGAIILITAGGGAFGAMLKVAQIGPAIQEMFRTSGTGASGLSYLFLGFGLAAVLKVAQGSSTVGMITASAMLAAMMTDPTALGFHPVYLATAIGAGSLIGSWMNDSGFWIFAKMSGLTELEALKSWTPLLLVLGMTSLIATLILVFVLPMPVTPTP